ncbi:hypothetical protein [Parasulfitobacter algicola]|uniref:Sulfotransferase family protein n=1 Tax=Parasulfitobacter algicola TaxID=2614809 RepID=A0ABX2IPG9_9RHOB|nr:hypothetical protein [Sulfitobacter algicola]NSX54782.1 hypothetical protein [Sulfitobacter algicola]
MTKLLLHLGAHKTATTHFQNSLFLSADKLKAKQIKYVPLSRCRNTYSRVIKACIRKKITVSEAKDRFNRFFAEDAVNNHTVIVSDENILGQFSRTLLTGIIYPEAEDYMALVRQIFEDADLSVFLTVRSYDTFFSSLFCEALRWQKLNDAREYTQNFIQNADWRDLNRRISVALDADIKLLFFEDYIKNPHAHLVTFTKCDFQDITIEQQTNLRSSMTGDAVNTVVAIAPFVSGQMEYRKTVAAIEQALPQSEFRKKFDPWTIDEKAILKDRYTDFKSDLLQRCDLNELLMVC